MAKTGVHHIGWECMYIHLDTQRNGARVNVLGVVKFILHL